MNDDYYDELIKQRIGEALRNQSRKEKLDIKLLEKWVEEERERRRPLNRMKKQSRRAAQAINKTLHQITRYCMMISKRKGD